MITVADQIVVLDDGLLAAARTRGELLRAGAAFAQMFREREHAATWRINARAS